MWQIAGAVIWPLPSIHMARVHCEADHAYGDHLVAVLASSIMKQAKCGVVLPAWLTGLTAQEAL